MLNLRSRCSNVAVLVLIAAVTPGCASPGGVAKVPGDDPFRCDLSPNALYEQLNLSAKLAATDVSSTPSLNFLLLSGGGARGSWGAGYLKGWHDSVDTAAGPSMPRFDVVTGVSTGALQATFAFIGDYSQIFEFYTTTESRDIWKKRFALFIPFSNSLLKSKPLVSQIKQRVTHDLLAAVNKQQDGRLLCVGAVSLKTGMFREWDLTAIAREYIKAGRGSERADELLNLYRMILLSSAAIPVAFPPVEITDKEGTTLYVDGGTRENVFVAFAKLLDFALATDGYQVGSDSSESKSMAELFELNAYVIVNGQLGIAPASVDNHIVPIALRSLDALTSESMNGAIYHIDYDLRQRGAENPINTRFTYIPSSFCLENSSLDFDPVEMTRQARKAMEYGLTRTWFEFSPDQKLHDCKTKAGTSQQSGDS